MRCQATKKITNGEDVLLNGQHNHPPNMIEEDRENFRKALLSAVDREPETTLKHIYECVVME